MRPSDETRTCSLLKLNPLGFRVISSQPGRTGWQLVGFYGRSKDRPFRHPNAPSTRRRRRGPIANPRNPRKSPFALCIGVIQRVLPLERRRQVRWLCSDEFHPTGVASNPAKSNDFILFRVLDVSPSGLRLQTSLRNNFIVRGMRLDVIVSFPMVSQITVRLTVQNVSFISRNKKEFLAVGAQIRRLDGSTIERYCSIHGSIRRRRFDTRVPR